MPEKTTQKEHGKKTAPPSEKEVQPEVVIQIPLAELHPFPDHPFQVRDDDSMRETAESVKAYLQRSQPLRAKTWLAAGAVSEYHPKGKGNPARIDPRNDDPAQAYTVR